MEITPLGEAAARAAQEQEQRPRRLVWHIPNAALTDVAGSLSHMPASLSHMPTPNDT